MGNDNIHIHGPGSKQIYNKDELMHLYSSMLKAQVHNQVNNHSSVQLELQKNQVTQQQYE